MRSEIKKWRKEHPLITYRSREATRIDNVTDAVMGIAITLLIFNLGNPNSFSGLMDFAKTLPAFLVSICFLFVIWREHYRFSEIYGMQDIWLVVLNTLFISLIIFYVYPLRFLTLFLTYIFFGVDLGIEIQTYEVPQLMIFYGIVAAAMYFCIWLFYARALKIKTHLGLTEFELFYTKMHYKRMLIMFTVPLTSIVLCWVGMFYFPRLSGMFGGLTYWLFFPFMMMWGKAYSKREARYLAGVSKT